MLKLTPQIWKKISAKQIHRGFIPRYDGPFLVVNRVGRVAYLLELPDRFKIHPTLRVSFLRKFHEDFENESRMNMKPAPSVFRFQTEKKLVKILDHRILGQSKKNRKTNYLVQWEGEAEEDATWERNVNLWQFEDAIEKYL